MSPELPYVCGFAVNPSYTQVLLIKKKRGPSFNVGKWNGIGGKIEIGEDPRGAMVREFREECGIKTQPEFWETFHVEVHLPRFEQRSGPRIYFMTCVLTSDEFDSHQCTTDEPVDNFYIGKLTGVGGAGPFVYNLRYLLEMVLVWHRTPEHRWLEG